MAPTTKDTVTFDRKYVTTILVAAESGDVDKVLAMVKAVADAWEAERLAVAAEIERLQMPAKKLQKIYDNIVELLGDEAGYENLADSLDGRTLKGKITKAAK
jgi:hypothetical protein